MDEIQSYRLQLTAESGAIPWVLRESEKIAHLFRDVTSFEHECYRKIGRMLDVLQDNGREKKALIRMIISQTRGDFFKSRNVRNDVYFSQYDGDNGCYEPADVLADVEGDALAGIENESFRNEKIALLAQGDSRKKLTLELWIRGYTNDSETSRLLAQHFGGKAESHRVFIQRFRAYCQRKLTEK
ncbi:hypothetical protein [Bacillus subtilis]|uniref:hypothetical protein n=1 Tax=Bacillus subtilis TaxID=1423 RepID=UPI003F86B479